MATAPTSRRLNLTRDQLAAFLGDHQQIRQFELLFATLDAISNQNITAGQVYAGPSSGAAAPPTFRALVQSDIPSEALTKTDDTNVTLTLGGSPATSLLAAVSLTLGWSGQLSAARGGTGQSSYAVGDLLYADTTTSLAKLPDVATGNALISGGVGVAPIYGKIGLTTHISGILPYANQTASVRSNQVLTWLSM